MRSDVSCHHLKSLSELVCATELGYMARQPPKGGIRVNADYRCPLLSQLEMSAFPVLSAWVSDVESLPTVNEIDDLELAVIVFPLAVWRNFFGRVPVLYHFAICEAK